MADTPKTIHGNNSWLRNAFHVHIDVREQENGTFQAHSPNPELTATGDSQTEAIRNLQQKLLTNGLQGKM